MKQRRKSFAAAGNQAGSEAGNYKQGQLNAILQADAAFMGKDYDKAYQLYDEAIVKNPDEAPYAMYQKALIAGLKSKPEEKIQLLQKVVKEYPKSRMATAAEYELGAAYLEHNQLTESKSIFEKLAKSDDKELRFKALAKLAFVEQKTGNYDQAIAHYKRLVIEYPGHPEREATLESLRNAYIQKGDVAAYYAFAKENNIESAGEENMDEDYFVMAENKYIDEDYKGAVSALDAYLSKFPNGANKVQAYYLKGESLLAQKEYDKAKVAYQEVIGSGDADYKSLADIKMAMVQYELKDYQAAITAAQQYLEGTGDAEAQVPAHLILMKAHNKLNQKDQAVHSAAFLKPYEDRLTDQEKLEMKLIRAYALQQDRDYTAARKMYEEVAHAKTGAWSAEARYRMAQTLLLEGKLKEAEAACDQAIKENQSEHYWMVKSYILIGEILGAQKDYFNARATLQSVVNNANNDELEQEARKTAGYNR
ncbi:MAG: tetratricopeptide repeat protein [Taibaiella sp.]|nr:tetratricopeptide repeat protein [Taibaiella sp.]